MQQDASSYLQHFGLHRDPFSDKGTRGLFFPGGGRKEIVDQLLHFVRYGNAPVLLAGPQGSGKTWVLHALLILLDDTVDVCFIPAALMMTPGQLANQIADDFAVDVSDIQLDVGEIWARIADRLKDLKENGRQSLLCIDSAEDLSAEVAESLFAAVGKIGDSLRVIFSGNTQATHVLEEAAAEQQLLLHRLEMKVFSKQDVQHYLRYRLVAAGYQGNMPFTDLQIEALVHRSQGSIEQLNHAARSMLQAAAGAVEQAVPASRSFPTLHAAALVFLALLIGVGIFWRSDEGEESDASRKEIVLALPEPATIEMLTEKDDQLESESAPPKPDTDRFDQAPSTSDVSEEKASGVDGLAKAADDEGSSVKNTSVKNTSVKNTSVEPDLAEAVPVPVPVIETASLEAKPASASVVEEKNQANDAAKHKPEEGSNDLAASARLDDDPVDTFAAEQRLLRWPASGYALQIFATHNGQRAKQFVDKHFGEADLLFYRVVQNEQPWYIVVNGPYSDRTAAKSAALQLPESLQRLRPWARPTKGIHRDIRVGER